MAANSEKREMVVRGADGQLKDEELWNEILGDDTHNTWDINKAEKQDETQPRQ